MNPALLDDLRALAVSGEGLLADTVLKGRNGDVQAHLAFLEVRCPQLAQKAVKDSDRAFWTIFLLDDAVSTLRHLVLYLYTDALPDSFGVNIIPALDLLIFAGSLVSSPAQVFSGTSRMKKSRLEDGSRVVRRLYALCEQHILSSITTAHVVEVLQTALKIGSKKLQNGVDRFLAGEGRDLIKCMSFNQSLFALNSEHPIAVARAVSAAAGNTQVLLSDSGDSTEVPPSQLLEHLEVLLESTRAADGTSLDLVSKVDCRICWEGQSEQATYQLAAHRFMLAARSAYFAAMLSSPMRESSSGHVPISLPLAPSSAAAKAFLRYLYTSTFLDEVGGQPLTTCDLVDLLAIVEGPGGHNFLQLSERALSEVQQHVLASLEGADKTASMIFLQRSMAQQCKPALPLAFDEALENCAVVCPDLESFKACFLTAKEEWWTPEMEQNMYLELLWRRSSVMQTECKESIAARRKEERALHFRIFHRKLDQREVSYLVSLDWCAAWRGFLVGRHGPPGPISNHRLVGDGSRSKSVSLSRASWKFLQSRYGGGPEIKQSGVGSRSSP
ncbi:USP33 [Symbiodinium sp. CCMP2592]|nr:USP33 [Symbiodinium sp. CCMP2592]